MIKIEKMNKNHINQVVEIENESFDIPWSRNSFEKELFENKFAYYFVALDGKKVVGYGGLWHIVNEGHITNIAVAKEYRNKGIGKLILKSLCDLAIELEMIGLTLEVRKTNKIAQNLYKKIGFKIDGIRREYYSDTKEDAIIMWKYFIPENEIE